MAALHLNSQVQQYDGFTPGQRVFGRKPKLPIGAAGNPNFTDFANPIVAQAAKSLSLVNTIPQIRKASLEADFNGEMQLCLERRVRNIKTEEFCLGQTVFFDGEKMESDKRWQGPGIVIARYGGAYALVHFRGVYLEVSLRDMRSADKILDVLGSDGTLQLHLANTKFSAALFGLFANVNFSIESAR